MRNAKRRLGELQQPQRDAIPAHTAAHLAFRHFCLRMWADSNFDNKTLCTLAWFATKAGALGMEDFMLDPCQAKHHSEKTQRALGLDLDMALYRIHDVPMWDSVRNVRCLQTIAIRLPHEALVLDFGRDPSAYCCATYHPEEWQVPSFLEHDLTVTHGHRNVAALGMYTDKVKYSKKDSFIRCSIGCVWKRSRVTSWVVKASCLCKCGCNGACTLCPIMDCFNQSVNALQDNAHWAKRHDGAPFGPQDHARRLRVGKLPMPVCALVEYRGDWPERAAVAGTSGRNQATP
jgi:hypothetical protein